MERGTIIGIVYMEMGTLVGTVFVERGILVGTVYVERGTLVGTVYVERDIFAGLQWVTANFEIMVPSGWLSHRGSVQQSFAKGSLFLPCLLLCPFCSLH